jgi:hypothetical protein
MKLITQNELRQLLSYDHETGIMRWIVRRKGVKLGAVAGCHDYDGYRLIKVNQRYYKAHRLAWLYVHGEWPNGIIDHINGNPDDNRITNLREADASRNAFNQGPRANGSSGYKGVHRQRNKWRATIQVNGRKTVLGLFDCPEEAAAVYAEAARRLHGEFARTD